MHLQSSDMYADLLTKPLPNVQFEMLRRALGMSNLISQ